jgi:hypothetical protein
MVDQVEDRQTLGKISCTAFVLNLAGYAALTSSREPHPVLLFILIGLAIAGLLSSIAGLVASRGSGSVPELSIIGFIVHLPSVGLGLFFLAVIFGTHH